MYKVTNNTCMNGLKFYFGLVNIKNVFQNLKIFIKTLGIILPRGKLWRTMYLYKSLSYNFRTLDHNTNISITYKFTELDSDKKTHPQIFTPDYLQTDEHNL